MKVVIIQHDIIWGEPQRNTAHLDELLAAAPKADLYVLPEMFSTGFATDKNARIESEPSTSLEWMKRVAAAKNAAFAGSIALDKGNGRAVNRLYFVKPDGQVTYYDKHHLFTYGGEGDRFDAGEDIVVVEWRGVRFRLAVCYDLRFPVWLRNDGAYDALLLVASWPVARDFAWRTLIRARAIENQCYVLAANRVGKDPVCEYVGGTVLLNPYGYDISAVPDNTEGFAEGEIDMEMLENYRAKFPALDGADKFEIR